MSKALVIAALAAALWSGQAAAHARLIRAAPRVGAAVAQPPTELRLWFSEAIDLPHSGVALMGPAGARMALGPLRLEGRDRRVLVAPVAGALAAGDYRVDWNVTSADTHRTDGDFKFTVRPSPKVR